MRINSKPRITPSELTPQPKAITLSSADCFEREWEVLHPADAPTEVPVESPDASGEWSSVFSWGAPILKSALNAGVSVVETQLSYGVAVANELLAALPERQPNAPTPSDNVFDLHCDSDELVHPLSNGTTVYSRTLDFSGAGTIEKLGAMSSPTNTLLVEGVELSYAAQTLLDLSRGEPGTQDLFIGGPEVSRENTGGHVTDSPNWKTNPVWFEASLRKLYQIADCDIDTTRLLTTFINQRVLNNLIYNLQDGVNKNLGALIMMGDVTMSWRVYREAPFVGAEQELFVRAIVEGKVPYAEVNDEMVPEMGSFRGAITVNLSANTARATYGASLYSKNLSVDSAGN